MAKTSTKSSTAPAVLEDEETVSEPSFKQLATTAINEAADALGMESKNRYKVQRAFGYIAMQAAIDGETFANLDELRDAVIERAGDLPAGFGLERSVAEVKAAKAPTKAPAKAKTAAKTPAKTAAKAPAKTARKRPTR